ncbi:F-box protein At2g02240-like isoform X2 [Zingiber officinale]|uniref:F-box protein At2g02240-like isoform X2 n=1 Tax=Zingiber officinale TaxID=94328 RepID=UPI001C4B394C|nr:F-box protein At2g02240-like isoform X2 [Zingiber officinale]
MPTEKKKPRSERDDGAVAVLPPECIAHVLSFTTPRDVCRASLVDKTFLATAETDALWERFLPSDRVEILSRAVDPVEYASNKELYFRLCNPILVDQAKMSFQLEKATGKKWYMISAEKMQVTWGDTPQYWRWVSLKESRFAQVVELLAVCWLHISASQLASVKLGAYASEMHVSLMLDDDDDEEDDNQGMEETENTKNIRLREDGWLQVELGEFYNNEGDEGEMEATLWETQELHWKQGLIIHGLEIRPKKGE